MGVTPIRVHEHYAGPKTTSNTPTQDHEQHAGRPERITRIADQGRYASPRTRSNTPIIDHERYIPADSTPRALRGPRGHEQYAGADAAPYGLLSRESHPPRTSALKKNKNVHRQGSPPRTIGIEKSDSYRLYKSNKLHKRF